MRLRKNLIQGIEALMLAMLCHWTNADGAAVILFIISIGLAFGKTKMPSVYTTAGQGVNMDETDMHHRDNT